MKERRRGRKERETEREEGKKAGRIRKIGDRRKWRKIRKRSNEEKGKK